MATPQSILEFWFGTDTDDANTAAQQARMWWSKNDQTDAEIRSRFEGDVIAAANGQHDDWTNTPQGLLALIVLTDQFSRNMYRGQPQSFAFDKHALNWTLQGLERGVDQMLRPIQRVFFYLPLEHAESIAHQDRAVSLFKTLVDEAPADKKEIFEGFHNYAIRHRDVIARFGRFPHRNAILKRASTDEEVAFLKTPGSSF